MSSNKQYAIDPKEPSYETHIVGSPAPEPYHTETRPSWRKITDEEYTQFSQNPKTLVGQKFTQEGGQELWQVTEITVNNAEEDNRYALLVREEGDKHRMLLDDLLRMLKEGDFTVVEIP